VAKGYHQVKLDSKTRDKIRAIGYLLETNGTHHTWAQMANGEPTNSGDPQACRWCLDGAIAAFGCAEDWSLSSTEVLREVAHVLGVEAYGVIGAWDGTTDVGREQIVRKLKNV
jgi:hypothetical protein